MDVIAHFWERLAHTPPLSRADLHLVLAQPQTLDVEISTSYDSSAGVMLYVPKAYRADVLAPDPAIAAAFANYIQHVGSAQPGAAPALDKSAAKPLPGADLPPAGNGRCAIDFLTGEAGGVAAMVPLLLPLVHRKAVARQMVNVVMQLPPEIPAAADPAVRPARETDLAVLNRWRRMYKDERGILFDADMDAWVETGRIFVYEAAGQVVTLAKFDLELSAAIEIGGVFTFPEYRQHGYGQRIVADLAARIRAAGKTPFLQVDETNAVARELYVKAGWKSLGRLARVWLSAS